MKKRKVICFINLFLIEQKKGLIVSQKEKNAMSDLL